MKWLSEIQRRMNMVPAKYLILDGNIQPGERIVGRLPEDLLRLYGLHLQVAEDTERLVRDHMTMHSRGNFSESSCEKFFVDVTWLTEEHEALMKFFWAAVRSEFGIFKGDIGVRAHGDVVAWDERPGPGKIDDVTLATEMLKAMRSNSEPN